MGKKRARTGFALPALTGLGLLLAVSVVALRPLAALQAQVQTGTSSSAAFPLDSCSRIEALFPLPTDKDASISPVEAWRDLYNATVIGILDTHLNPPPAELTCADSPRQEASEALTAVADKLQPWKNGAPYAERDMPAVLLAYIRAYECTLEEQRQDLFTIVTKQGIDVSKGKKGYFAYDPHEGDEDGTSVSAIAIALGYVRQLNVIEDELRVARPTLRRTLQYISGRDRFAPLQQNLQCLERTTLEIRNILSLAAETASCVPKIWGARDPLYGTQE